MIKSILVVLLLTITVSAQLKTESLTENVYPSRISNYCLFPDAVAVASSTANANFPASSMIDGDRVGQNCSFSLRAPCWGNKGGWNDATRDVYPDIPGVKFGQARSISRIVVVTYQDNFSVPSIEPYLGYQGPAPYGIEDFTVEVLDTSGNWVQVGAVEENHDIILEFTFTAVLGTEFRIIITDAYGHYSRVIELEAYAV